MITKSILKLSKIFNKQTQGAGDVKLCENPILWKWVRTDSVWACREIMHNNRYTAHNRKFQSSSNCLESEEDGGEFVTKWCFKGDEFSRHLGEIELSEC